MIHHVLNGDSLAHTFPEANLPGETVVFREALIDGDLSGDTLQNFWHARAKYHGSNQVDYDRMVIQEINKLLHAPDQSEFNLWFEYDLFCQVNLWFLLNLLHGLAISKKVFLVNTSYLDREDKNFWNGFGPANADQLKTCFVHRILLSKNDLQFDADLWMAYKNNDGEKLHELSETKSSAFPYLKEVVQAHLDRFPKNGEPGRPEKVLIEILKHHPRDFHQVFTEFWKTESIYGFGDTQVKHLYEKVKEEYKKD